MGSKRDKKNILIVFLLVIVFIMSVGFALLGRELEVTATGTVAGDWDIHFADENIEPVTKTDGVDVLTALLDGEKLRITLNAAFEKPGDKITYEFKIENTGTIDAYLKNVKLVGQEGNTEAIKLSYDVKDNENQTTYAKGHITGLTPEATIIPTAQTALLGKQVTENDVTTTQNNYLTVTLEYVDTTTTVAETASATYTLTLEYEQTNAN